MIKDNKMLILEEKKIFIKFSAKRTFIFTYHPQWMIKDFKAKI